MEVCRVGHQVCVYWGCVASDVMMMAFEGAEMSHLATPT